MSHARNYRDPHPKVDLHYYSKDFLVHLLRLYARFFLSIDGFWYLAVRDRTGNEEALKCDLAVWEREARYESKRLANLFGVSDPDLASFVHILQLTPWFRNLEYTIEERGAGRFVLTVTDCPTLQALEKEGQGREESICGTVEPSILSNYARALRPTIQIRPLRLPPVSRDRQVYCQWEFTDDETIAE